MNIYFHSKNIYLLEGLIHEVTNYLLNTQYVEVNLVQELNEDNLRIMDLMVVALEEQDVFQCNKIFNENFTGGVILLLPQQTSSVQLKQLCIKSLTILYHDSPVSVLRSRLDYCLNIKKGKQCVSCETCFYGRDHLSKQQKILASCLVNGLNMLDISKLLRVSYKTAYNHKYRLMEVYGVTRENHLMHCIKSSLQQIESEY